MRLALLIIGGLILVATVPVVVLLGLLRMLPEETPGVDW